MQLGAFSVTEILVILRKPLVGYQIRVFSRVVLIDLTVRLPASVMVAWNDEYGDAGSLYFCQFFYHIFMTRLLGIFRHVASDEQQIGFLGDDQTAKFVEDRHTLIHHLLGVCQIGLPSLVVRTVKQFLTHHMDIRQEVYLLVSSSRYAAD